MIENKLPIFEGVPQSELSKISDDIDDDKSPERLRGIEKEFEETNLHTKQTQEKSNYTDNTDNIDSTRVDANEFKPKEKRKNRLSNLMGEKGGVFAVDLMDMLIPTVVVLIVGYFGYIFDKKDLKLNKDEKEALTPALMDVLDEINLDFSNPYVNLGIMLAIVYGTKIADKLPTLKKKVAEKTIETKNISEAVSEVLSNNGEKGEVTSDLGKFEIDYSKLVDPIRLARKRGVGDAKQYLAENYSEKIKAIAAKHKIPFHMIEGHLNYVHTPKKRKPDFNIEDAETQEQ